MSFNINKQLNAEDQEPKASAEGTATTNTPDQEANVPEQNVEQPAAETPEAKVETPEAKVETTEAKAETTEAKAEAPEAKAETPEVKAEVPAAKPAKEPEVETAHDDFDWTRDKRNVAAYSEEEKQKYDKVYDNTFKQINDGEMIQATI